MRLQQLMTKFLHKQKWCLQLIGRYLGKFWEIDKAKIEVHSKINDFNFLFIPRSEKI